MCNINVFGIIEEDVVNAPGISLAVFCQGCSHPLDTPNMVEGHCVGCHNPESQSFKGGTRYSVEQLIEKLIGSSLHNTLVLSGGEPMCQAKALLPFTKEVKERGYKVWMYTGYTWEQLENNEDWKEIRQYIDVLVDGPFIESLKSYKLKFKGSKNQRVINVQKSITKGSIVLYKSPHA